MRKLLVALTLLSASLSTAALAQQGRGTDAEQKACTRDVQKFCRPVIDQGDFEDPDHEAGFKILRDLGAVAIVPPFGPRTT